jgi:hypothetical protein
LEWVVPKGSRFDDPKVADVVQLSFQSQDDTINFTRKVCPDLSFKESLVDRFVRMNGFHHILKNKSK